GGAEAGVGGGEAVGRSADVVRPAGHRDLRFAAEPHVVAAGETTDVVDSDGFGGELVFVGDQRRDPRCLITGGDCGQGARRGALHRLGGAGVLTVDGHLRGACDERSRRRFVVGRTRGTSGDGEQCRGGDCPTSSHSAESTTCASPSSALTPNCPDGSAAPASSGLRTATSTRPRSSPS